MENFKETFQETIERHVQGLIKDKQPIPQKEEALGEVNLFGVGSP